MSTTQEFLSPAVQGETFLHAQRVSRDEVGPGNIAVVGVPHGITKISRPGTWEAPQALREATYMFGFAITQMGGGELADIDTGRVYRYRPGVLVDTGDLELGTDAAENFNTIADAVERVAGTGALPLVLGGDHFVSYPAVAGVARVRSGPLAYLHVDMHPDLADEVPGFGRLSCGSPVRRLIEDGTIDPARTLIFGVDPLQPRNECDFAHETGVRLVSSTRAQRDGIERTLRQELERILDGAAGMYASIDIDAVARVYAPGTGNAVGVTGLTPADVIAVAAVLAGEQLVGLDLVEVSPRWDLSGSTAGLAVSILYQVLWGRLFAEVGA